MGWIVLLSGIAINVSGVIGLRFAQHAEQPFLSAVAYTVYLIGFFVLSQSFKYVGMGLAYAFWSGIGSLSVVTVGVIFFSENINPNKLVFFLLIALGVMGLSLEA